MDDVERFHSIITLEKHKHLNYVIRGMYHGPWAAHTIGQHQAWEIIISLRTHIRSDDIGCGMPSWPFVRTQSRMTSDEACPHGPWEAHMVGGRRASHGIIALGKKTPSDDVRNFKPSSLLGSTYNRMTLGVACNYRPWKA